MRRDSHARPQNNECFGRFSAITVGNTDYCRLTEGRVLQERIFNSSPGATPTLTVERNGSEMMLRPTLIAWPSSLTY